MKSNPLRLAGKRAYITGAAGGLGSAIARRMAEHGARVFLTDNGDPSALAQLKDEINTVHGEQVAWRAVQDVRDEARWQALPGEAACAIQRRAQAGAGALRTKPRSILDGIARQSTITTRDTGPEKLVWPGLLRRLDRHNPGYAS